MTWNLKYYKWHYYLVILVPFKPHTHFLNKDHTQLFFSMSIAISKQLEMYYNNNVDKFHFQENS